MLEVELRWKGKERLDIRPVIPTIIKYGAAEAERRMKKNVRVRTGRLRTSIRSDISKNRAVIAPHTLYAAAQEYGMRGAPGRYVPAIGVRLTGKIRGYPSGWWPGFKGKFYVHRTKEYMKTYLPQLVKDILKRHMED